MHMHPGRAAMAGGGAGCQVLVRHVIKQPSCDVRHAVQVLLSSLCQISPSLRLLLPMLRLLLRVSGKGCQG